MVVTLKFDRLFHRLFAEQLTISNIKISCFKNKKFFVIINPHNDEYTASEVCCQPFFFFFGRIGKFVSNFQR